MAKKKTPRRPPFLDPALQPVPFHANGFSGRAVDRKRPAPKPR